MVYRDESLPVNVPVFILNMFSIMSHIIVDSQCSISQCPSVFCPYFIKFILCSLSLDNFCRHFELIEQQKFWFQLIFILTFSVFVGKTETWNKTGFNNEP